VGLFGHPAEVTNLATGWLTSSRVAQCPRWSRRFGIVDLGGVLRRCNQEVFLAASDAPRDIFRVDRKAGSMRQNQADVQKQLLPATPSSWWRSQPEPAWIRLVEP